MGVMGFVISEGSHYLLEKFLKTLGTRGKLRISARGEEMHLCLQPFPPAPPAATQPSMGRTSQDQVSALSTCLALAEGIQAGLSKW